MAADGHKAALAHEKGGTRLWGGPQVATAAISIRTPTPAQSGYCSHLDQDTGTSTITIRSPAAAQPTITTPRTNRKQADLKAN